jgi:hypothetical protein
MIPAGLAGLPDLLSELTGKFAHLFRTELRLAQAELTDKAASTATALVPAAVGAVLLIPVLVILLEAAAEALITQGISPALSRLIVGVVALVVAAGLIWAGIHRLKRLSAQPHKLVRQVKRDVAMAKKHLEAS